MTKPSWIILFIDAAPEDRDVYRRYLQYDPAATYRFWEAEWGAQALALCQSLRPDCILLDYRLPDLDGLACLTRLQAQAETLAVPVILLTGAGSAAVTVEARKQGIQDCLVKEHLTSETLRQAVHHVIEKATLLRPLAVSRLDLTTGKQAKQTFAQAYTELQQCLDERTAALRHEMAARQRAEEECRRLEHEVQRSAHFALLGRLAASVSHEIRNPLGAVFLHVDFLEEALQQPTLDSPAEIAQSLSEIKTQLARLAELVQDYLSLVRVASLQRTPQDLGAAVQAWVTEVQGPATARGVMVHCQGLADLGQVAFHPSTLRRAVLNLIQNALDALPQGGTVMLESQTTPTHVLLHVRDTGVGIPRERLAQIFEQLYTTKPGGTGLGLSIVQEIVAAHEGQVTVQSEEGCGTTFTITLPRAPGAVSS